MALTSTPIGITRLKRPTRQQFFAGHLATIALAVYLLPAALTQRIFNQDSRQHISWMAVYQDPELFKNDSLKSYYLDAFAPPGYKAYFWIATRLVDPQIAAELLGLVIALVSAWLAYQLGTALLNGDPVGGLACLIVYLAAGGVSFDMHFVRWVQGGLQRAFLVPCMLLAIIGLVNRSGRRIAIASIVGALFYPPAAIMIGAIWLFALLLRWQRERSQSIEWLWFLTGNLSAIVILLLAKPVSWTNYTLNEALRTPDFFDRPLAIDSTLHHTLWPYLRELVPFPLPAIILFFSLLFLIAVWRRKEFPWVVFFAIVLGSWSTYALAYGLFNRLYEPTRYLFPIRCLWLLVVPFAASHIILTLRQFMPRRSLPLGLLLIAWCVTTTFAAGYLIQRRIEKGNGGVVGALPPAVYEYLSTTPKTTLIAGHPIDVGDVPLLSRRRVLLLAESLYPCHKEFYDEAKRRFVAELLALWSPHLDAAITLRDQFGVDLLVVTSRPRSKDPYIQTVTFAEEYRRLAETLANQDPAVMHPPPESVVFAVDGCQVIDLRRLKK